MHPPPPLLDGATVLLWAPLTETNPKTGAVRLFADGIEQSTFSALAVAEHPDSPNSGVYLFYCDDRWQVLNDSLYRDFNEARKEAELQFLHLENSWREPQPTSPDPAPGVAGNSPSPPRSTI